MKTRWTVGFCLLACILVGLSIAQQPSALTGRIASWPSPSWPAGNTPEVRLVLGSSQTIASSAIDAQGRFSLTLNDTMTTSGLEPIQQAMKLFQNCDFEARESVSGAQGTTANLYVVRKEDNRAWANLFIRDGKHDPDGSTSTSSLLIYVDRAVRINGNGSCGTATQKHRVNIVAQFAKGWNAIIFDSKGGSNSILQVRVDKDPSGAFEWWPLAR